MFNFSAILYNTMVDAVAILILLYGVFLLALRLFDSSLIGSDFVQHRRQKTLKNDEKLCEECGRLMQFIDSAWNPYIEYSCKNDRCSNPQSIRIVRKCGVCSKELKQFSKPFDTVYDTKWVCKNKQCHEFYPE